MKQFGAAAVTFTLSLVDADELIVTVDVREAKDEEKKSSSLSHSAEVGENAVKCTIS